MTLSRDQIRHLAALARLELSEAEMDRMAADLGGVLAHLQVLRRLDAEHPAAPPDEPDRAAPLRPDRVAPDPLRVPPAELAPAWGEGHFLVPRLPALDPEAGEGDGG